jgi:hypothetical protein
VRRGAYRVLVVKTERDHLEDLGINRKIILKWILTNHVGRACTRLFWLRTGTGGEVF